MTRRSSAVALVLSVGLLTCAVFVSGAGADSFTPVRMTVGVTPVARANAPLKASVTVSADAGVLDIAQGSVRVGVKLAIECGGSFETTPGVTLLNAGLTPQPKTGVAFSGSATGSGRPTLFGTQTLCVYVEDSVDRVYATDESGLVNVTHPCTTDARRFDAADKALKTSQRQFRRTKTTAKARRAQLQRTIVKRRKTANADQRAARQACGAGVPL